MNNKFALLALLIPGSAIGATWWMTGCAAESSPKGSKCVKSTELCNLKDDDCDGLIDEDENGNKMTRPCQGPCGEGTQTCIDGQWSKCDAPEPKKEICNGKDDDCDGVTDNGFECARGSTEPCGIDIGICKKGTKVCNSHCEWGSCQGDIEPESKEICGNNKDDNCNGSTDEGCKCSDGQTKTCCGGQTVECKNGKFPPCPPPPQELCNGKDDDCDGVTDNNLPEDPYRKDEESGGNDTCNKAYKIPAYLGNPVTQDSTKTFTFYLNKEDGSEDKDYITFATKERTDASCPDGWHECYTLTVEVVDPKDSDVEFCLYQVGQPGADPDCSHADHKWCSGQGGNPKNKVTVKYAGGCSGAFSEDGKQYVVEVFLAPGAPKTCHDYELKVHYEGTYPQEEACQF